MKKKNKLNNNYDDTKKRLIKNRKPKYMLPIEYSKDRRFINREISWIEFDLRVLEEARSKSTPLMEKLSFLSITASNLDEFFMVRVASLKDQKQAGYSKPDIAGLLPDEQLNAISRQTHALYQRIYSTYSRMILPELKKRGIHLVSSDEYTEEDRKELKEYFDQYIYPILTPSAVDASRPFPLIRNKFLNLCAILINPETDEESFVTIQIPDVLPRLYLFSGRKGTGNILKNQKSAGEGGTALDQQNILETNAEELPCQYRFTLLEEIIKCFLPELFSGMKIKCSSFYRILRNADLDIDEEDAEDLLIEIERQIKLRPWGEVIRLEASADIDNSLIEALIQNLEVDEEDIYLIDGPLDITVMSKLRGHEILKRMKGDYYPPYTPKTPYQLLKRKELLRLQGNENPDIFSCIREGSILMHHPYDSFDPVLELVETAAKDPDVLAIKQTLYRISSDSPLIMYLEEAANNGKQVLVLVELKARFDEENNIHWARRLEKAGCHVIYGLYGLKTHSKITLIVRSEDDGIRRYLHLGTGNYNDKTAKLYTDMGYMVSNAALGSDATEFFNMLTGYAEPEHWNALVAAPIWLRKKFYQLIDREIMNVRAGREGRMRCKMNSLVDADMIKKLYEASKEGVKIELIVRGICCLRPGVEGLSENISVRSLIGRYLEHSRIYEFFNDGNPEIYLASADWMTRNLDRRVELMFPITENECKALVQEVLDIQFNDTERSHIALPDGDYKHNDRRGKPKLDAQERNAEIASERAEKHEIKAEPRSFEPAFSSDMIQ